jgi:hypothetical protein
VCVCVLLCVCVCVDVSAIQDHSQPMPCFAFAHKEKQIVYAVIELSDAEEEEEVVLDHGDDIIVQRAKRKKGSVTVKNGDMGGRAVKLVTPECTVGAGEVDRRVAASASHASRWVCAICTYCHRPEEWQYLQCALCASNRPALSLPSQVC